VDVVDVNVEPISTARANTAARNQEIEPENPQQDRQLRVAIRARQG
jgi:hypothetical protein